MPLRIACALIAVLAATASVLAETGGTLRGTVIDAQGQPLPGVVLAIQSSAAGARQRGAVSDSGGQFLIPGLPAAADYVLRASLQGYATVVMADVEIGPGAVTILKVSMPLESTVRERVMVRATAPVVALEEKGTTTRYSSEYLEALPILGRNYQDVLSLSPGVSDVDGDGNPNIHGARDTDVGTLVDGVNTTDPLTGKVGFQLNIESIQEVEVKTSGATAEYGRAQGGFANILTKSGGNDFQGSFKFFWRGSRLDGDGAGQDDPRLHGGVGEIGLRDLSFNDYLPFLSLSGPFVKDHAWYYATVEYVRKEEPVNALSQAFVTGLREFRVFSKGTWQATPNLRLGLVLSADPQRLLNQGLNSLTREETGYTVEAGGRMLTARATGVLSPSVALETAASYLETKPALLPSLGLDTNGDGMTYVSGNGDRFLDAKERDPGEDLDNDGAFDTWEDTMFPNGMLDQREITYCHDATGAFGPSPPLKCSDPFPVLTLVDEDGFRGGMIVAPQFYFPPGDRDRRVTPPGGCEGRQREDLDCDGHLDSVHEDVNGNGRMDPGEDLDHDGRLDPGTEDRNGNHYLDDNPFPRTAYPYGELRPVPADRDYVINLRDGRVSGPYYQDYQDSRSRASLRQDLSVFVPDFKGSHDLKVGYLLEREQFSRDEANHAVTAVNDPGYRTGIRLDEVMHPELHYDCNPYTEICKDPGLGRLTAILPIVPTAEEGASGWNGGLYVQDTWKPDPRVSVALGLRFDRESLATSGETFFDPETEHLRGGRLLALAGDERNADDLVSGNGDGIFNRGIPSDPLFASSPDPRAAVAPVADVMRHAALLGFMHPSSEVQYSSPALAQLFPQIFHDNQVDLEALRALGVPVQQPESFQITNNNLSPRLSVSWDPQGAGRTKLYATWGRYYDRLFLSSITGEQGLQTVQRYYVLDRDGFDVQRSPVTGAVIGSTPNHQFGDSLSSSPPSITQVDRALRTPYSDEFTFGFEREVAPEVALAVRYISRNYRDQLQDVDVNHETRIDPATGRLADRIGLLISVPTDPPGGPPIIVRAPDGRPDLFIRNYFYNQVLRVGNYNHAKYHAIELELRRRLSRRWQLDGSYVYSRAQGQAEDFQSRLGNDPSALESEFGYLDFDQRHVVKLNMALFLPHDWQMGASSEWASGLPYSVVSRFFALDNADFQQFRTRYGYIANDPSGLRFVPLPRNSGRNNATLDLNLSARKHFVLGKTVWSLALEVFNVLNADSLHILSVDPNRTQGFDPSGRALLASPSELDATQRFGRRYQVGFQVAF